MTLKYRKSCMIMGLCPSGSGPRPRLARASMTRSTWLSDMSWPWTPGARLCWIRMSSASHLVAHWAWLPTCQDSTMLKSLSKTSFFWKTILWSHNISNVYANKSHAWSFQSWVMMITDKTPAIYLLLAIFAILAHAITAAKYVLIFTIFLKPRKVTTFSSQPIRVSMLKTRPKWVPLHHYLQ